MNLVVTEDCALDADGYLPVGFRHNRMGDSMYFPYNGIVSFSISGLKETYPGLKGFRIAVSTMNHGNCIFKVSLDDSQEPEIENRNLSQVPELAQ